MKKILQKIAWKTRKWNFKIQLLNIYIHDGDSDWGFDLLTITKNYSPHSLLSFVFRLPNGADVKRFTIDEFDLFFLRVPLWKVYDKLSESKLWAGNLTKLQEFKLKVLDKLFR